MYRFSISEAQRSGTVKANLWQKQPFNKRRGPVCAALSWSGVSSLGEAQGSGSD